MQMKKVSVFALLLGLLAGTAYADEYVIDGTGGGMHSFVQWRVMHAGISPLWGRFNDITGSFTYDADDIESSSLEVTIATASLDSNHAERDTHLKTADYIDAETYPEATFVGTAFERLDEDVILVTGNFTFRDVTQELTFEAIRTGEGSTLFGDYRVGFEAYSGINPEDFGVTGISPPQVDLILSIEGIRQ